MDAKGAYKLRERNDIAQSAFGACLRDGIPGSFTDELGEEFDQDASKNPNFV